MAFGASPERVAALRLTTLDGDALKQEVIERALNLIATWQMERNIQPAGDEADRITTSATSILTAFIQLLNEADLSLIAREKLDALKAAAADDDDWDDED